jgi:hypothetical protein
MPRPIDPQQGSLQRLRTPNRFVDRARLPLDIRRRFSSA